MPAYLPQIDEDAAAHDAHSVSVAVSPQQSCGICRRSVPSRSKIFYGWFILVLAVAIQASSYPGTTTGFGAMLDIMIVDVGTSLTEMGTIYSVASFVGGVLSPVTGFAVDRYGGRITISVLMLMFCVSFIFLSYSTNRYAVCLGFMVIRFSGIGGMAVSSASVLAKWFEKYRGRAMGLMTVFSSLCNSGTSIALRQSVQTWGWRAVFQGIAAIGLCILLPIFAIFVRSTPEDMGLLPDGRPADQSISAAAADGQELRQLHASGPPGDAAKNVGAVLMKVNFTLMEAARTAVFWVLIAGSFLNATVAGGVFFHISTFLSDNGLSGSSVQDVFLPYGICMAVSAVFFGWALDRFPMKFSLCTGYIVQALSLLSLYNATSRPLAVLTGCLLGVNGGCLITCFRTVFAMCFGRKNIGAISSFNRSVQIIGTSVGPVSLALVRDAFGAALGSLQPLHFTRILKPVIADGLRNLNLYFMLPSLLLSFVSLRWCRPPTVGLPRHVAPSDSDSISLVAAAAS